MTLAQLAGNSFPPNLRDAAAQICLQIASTNSPPATNNTLLQQMPPAPEDKHQINHHKAESQETDPFLSETEKGSFEEEYNENVSLFQIYLIFFLLCAYFESQIFWTQPWHSLV